MLDGAKRWIGNGTWADVVVVWARSSETQQVGHTGRHRVVMVTAGGTYRQGQSGDEHSRWDMPAGVEQ